jgi:recombination protein RecA
VKVVKNKVAPPFKEAQFDVIYGEGISKVGELVDLGVRLELVEKAGAWFTCCGERLQGREAVKDFLAANPDKADELEEQIRADAYKLMSPQALKAAKAAGRAIDVSAEDFDDGDGET